MNRLQSLKLVAQASIIVLVVFLLVSISSGGVDNYESVKSLEPASASAVKPLRAKRSPFIVAFQVTRPPGLFQISMRKPAIMGVMSNMTSMILGSELARMFSRGFSSQQILVPLNLSNTSSLSSQVVAK